ncbi:GNAT family N-acetyltransferase [Streptomyces sp. NPDC059477]|uniref:GNAT family N-acetyltransferase n=1 Tax=Streptomyces sp. NPDC059477 TaxID=3346847 RepID=UPI0036C49862
MTTRTARHTSAPNISDLSPLWRTLAKGLYSSPEWLASYERPGIDRTYTLVTGTGGPRLGVVGELTARGHPIVDNPARLLHMDPVDLSPYLGSGERQRLDRARAESARSWTPDLPGVVSALPGGFLPGVLRADPDDFALAEEAVTLLEHQAHEAGAHSTALAHVPETDRTLRDVLARRGYSSFTCVAECVLRTPWRSFEAYLGAMTERRRSRVRRELHDFAESGAALVPVDPQTLGDRHALLHQAHRARYGHTVTLPGARRILAETLRHLGGSVRLLEVRARGRLVAFLLYHESDGLLYPKLFGLSDDVDAVAPFALSRLCYYAMVERAVARGLHGIVLGPEAYGAKARHGCGYEQRLCHVKFHHRPRRVTDEMARLLDTAYRRRLNSQPWCPL